MKLVHTQAKKARRASGFHKSGNNKAASEKRRMLRAKELPKTYGMHVTRIQRIFLKKDRFGAPIYRFVKHVAQSYFHKPTLAPVPEEV